MKKFEESLYNGSGELLRRARYIYSTPGLRASETNAAVPGSGKIWNVRKSNPYGERNQILCSSLDADGSVPDG